MITNGLPYIYFTLIDPKSAIGSITEVSQSLKSVYSRGSKLAKSPMLVKPYSHLPE